MSKHFDSSTLDQFSAVFASNLLGSACGHRSLHIGIVPNGDASPLSFVPNNVFVVAPDSRTIAIVTDDNLAINTNDDLSLHLLGQAQMEQFNDLQSITFTADQLELLNDTPILSQAPIALRIQVQNTTPIAASTQLITAIVTDLKIDKNILGHEGNLRLADCDIVSRTSDHSFYSTTPITITSTPKHDSIVYDEETNTYNASILPYASNVGAPAIEPNDVSAWKNRGINRVNHHLKNQYDNLKEEYDKMTDLYRWNDIIYGAKISFEPVIGEIYHLYKDKNRVILSLISPDEWNKEYLGSFRLNVSQIWEKID